MKSVSRGFCSIAEREGHSLGIIPMNSHETSFVPHNKYPNPYIEIPIMTPLGVYDPENPENITRNHVNILTSDIVIALPGMGGTRNEISLAQKFNKPLLLFGPMTEFQDLSEDIDRAENLSQASHWLGAHIK
jgi:predicted Rossmann-fold nucleotide-binding protein